MQKAFVSVASLLGLLFLSSEGQAKECRSHYVGSVITKWNDDGRTMELVSGYTFVNYDCSIWSVPAHATIDGATIPPYVWSLAGGPLEDRYRNASVIHDWFCDRKTRPWIDVHRMFFSAMVASGVPRWRAMLMYAAVYLKGPRWSDVTVRNNRLLTKVEGCPFCLSDESVGDKDLERRAAKSKQSNSSGSSRVHKITVLESAAMVDQKAEMALFDTVKRTPTATLVDVEKMADRIRIKGQPVCPVGYQNSIIENECVENSTTQNGLLAPVETDLQPPR